jgi:hypothetical protein
MWFNGAIPMLAEFSFTQMNTSHMQQLKVGISVVSIHALWTSNSCCTVGGLTGRDCRGVRAAH